MVADPLEALTQAVGHAGLGIVGNVAADPGALGYQAVHPIEQAAPAGEDDAFWECR